MYDTNNLPGPPVFCSHCNSTGISTDLDTLPLPYSLTHLNHRPDPTDIQEFIDRYDENLHTLEVLVAHRRKFIDMQRSMLSPIRKLSDELLIKVVQYTTVTSDEYDMESDGIDMSSNSGIWSLREVCGWFRNIIDGTPTLWSKFYYTDKYKNVNEDMLEMRTDLCLRLSGTNQLAVSILPNQHTSYPSRGFIVPIYNKIMEQSHRLHTFAFDIHALWRHDSPQPNFVNLRKLYLEDPCYLSRIDERFCFYCPFDYFKTATKLETVELKEITFDDALELTWTSVKNLRMEGCGAYETKNLLGVLLAHMPHLENLSLNNSGGTIASSGSTDETLQLLSLRNLDIDSLEGSRVCCPLLSNLTLQECFHHPDEFQAMIQHSGCVLTHFDVIICPDVNMLILIPNSVEDLTLSLRSRDEEMKHLQQLSRNSKTNGVLPYLKKLTLNIQVNGYNTTGPDNTIIKVITDIMQSRSFNNCSTGLSPLLSVKCTFDDRENVIDLLALQDVGTSLGINTEVVNGYMWRRFHSPNYVQSEVVKN